MNDLKAELTVRLAERNELEQVNVLRGQVNRLHSDARPDMFKAGFCDELKEYVYAFLTRRADTLLSLNAAAAYAVLRWLSELLSPSRLTGRA